MEKEKMMEREPQLSVFFSRHNELLKIRYRITNNTNQSLYIFNVIWDVSNDGKYILAKEQMYVSLLDDSIVSFSKRIPPLPSTRVVEFRYVPYVTKIEPGKDFEEEVNLKIPIDEFNPYFPKLSDSNTEIRMAKSAVFSIDYIFETDGLKIEETEIKGAMSVWHPRLMEILRTLRSKAYPLQVEISFRSDEFERF